MSSSENKEEPKVCCGQISNPKSVPVAVDLSQGDVYVCRCGASKTFPKCDGSHVALNEQNGSNFKPLLATKDTHGDSVYVCQCGLSKQRDNYQPFCDGSHKQIVGEGDTADAGTTGATATATEGEQYGVIFQGVPDGLNPTSLLDGQSYPVTRRREVKKELAPYTERVKVPCPKRVIVPTTIQHKILVTVFEEVNAEEPMEEEYSDYDYEEVEEEVTYWEEQQVERPVQVKVPVVEEQEVERQTVKFEKENGFVFVRVPVHKKVQVQGVRYDEIEEQKVVEVEEWEEFEMVPHKTGLREAGAFRDVGSVARESQTVRRGDVVFSDQRIVTTRVAPNTQVPVVMTGKEVAYEDIPTASAELVTTDEIPEANSVHIMSSSTTSAYGDVATQYEGYREVKEVSQRRTAYLKNLFDRCDVNKDGAVSRLELLKRLQNDKETQDAFKVTDTQNRLSFIESFGNLYGDLSRDETQAVTWDRFSSYLRNN